MSAERLNSVMVLHENREAANELFQSMDVGLIMLEFISCNDTQKGTGTFDLLNNYSTTYISHHAYSFFTDTVALSRA